MIPGSWQSIEIDVTPKMKQTRTTALTEELNRIGARDQIKTRGRKIIGTTFVRALVSHNETVDNEEASGLSKLDNVNPYDTTVSQFHWGSQ